MAIAPLSAMGLCKRFGAVSVLDQVDVELPQGSITALLGRSGAGKTTLLRALSLLEAADSGVLNILGQTFDADDGQPPAPDIWPALTVVFQDLYLWPHLTCGRNISMPAELRDPLGGRARARDVAGMLGLEELLDRRPAQISRGQRQLVALARAVALDPAILLLDEITASLDVESAALVGEMLGKLRGEGKAILLITHQLGFARKRADFFLFLDGGRVVERGPAERLHHPDSVAARRFVEIAATVP